MPARERTLRRRQERTIKATSKQRPNASRRSLAFGLFLVLGTLVLYNPVRSHDFINYDDDAYVTKNPNVNVGLSWQTVRWAFTSTKQGANWHPVTWLSHALDCQLFGLDAGYHHLTSLLIHTLNVLLLFLLLRWATGAVGLSFMVAALFAWHPFSVESVAWIAERKNVLSTLFFLLTLGAYGWYARKPGPGRMAIVAGLFLLALASKPMVVTLPFVLVLLDYWPMQRVAGWTEASNRISTHRRSVGTLLLEKAPLFVLAAASCAITVWAQKTGGAVRSLQGFPFGARVGNALVSYVTYLWKTFWPAKFALFYPHPGASLPLWKPILSAMILIAASALVWKQRHARPYLLVGWLWFLGTLVPVIGVVQVGDQGMADRYAYLPLIGLFVITVWGADELLNKIRGGSALRWGLSCLVLGVIFVLSRQQVGYWQNDISVWSHTLEVTTDNATAEREIAIALAAENDIQDAMPHFLNVARLNPKDVSNHVNIGAYKAQQGDIQDAAREFQTAVQLTDQGQLSSEDLRYRSSALLNLGFADALLSRFPEALTSLQRAKQSDPGMVEQVTDHLEHSVTAASSEDNCIKLSLLLQANGQKLEAAKELEEAIHTNPEYANARQLLRSMKAGSM